MQNLAYPSGNLALGHTRLSIIDLTDGGHQPMETADGNVSLIFNGEIYNYQELRNELARFGATFSSKSDTEVLLQAWATWNEESLSRLVGMFAFAVVDQRSATLTIARDAFGIKPLFYSQTPWGFCFASELPACVTLRGDGAKLNLQRATDYLLHGDYDSNSQTFVEGVYQLTPGTLLTVDLRSGKIKKHRHWWNPDLQERGRPRFEDATEQLRQIFLESVRFHLRSDVPLGTALSGGIDSSAVAYAMRHLEPDAALHTFSFVARGSSVSEEHWIDTANAGLRATSHRVVIEPSEIARDVDDLIAAQGEPFGSTSIYAQYRVFKLAREAGIRVTLDGQGADELLGGYSGYPGQRAHSLLDQWNPIAAATFLRHWSTWPGRKLSDGIHACVAQYASGRVYDVLRRTLRHGTAHCPDWLDANHLRESGVQLAYPRQWPDPRPGRRLVAELAMSATRRGLPALLRHADRNSMRFSIESRVPFLTTRLADFLLGLPEDYLVSFEGRTKHVFREAMRGIVPDSILDRRDKIGFETPEKEWFRALGDTPRQWIREAQEVPFLRPARMLQNYDAMLAGTLPFSWQAWRWMNFCRWHTRVLQPMQFSTTP